MTGELDRLAQGSCTSLGLRTHRFEDPQSEGKEED